DAVRVEAGEALAMLA
ncbi:hypothetical protein CFC21_063108, partial [Triticum aestivum]